MLRQPDPTHSITADASGSWGCRAFSSNGAWFQLQWPSTWSQYHIAAKEMVPVVVAIAVWGHDWQSCSVLVRSDNMAVVSALSSGSAKDPLLMHLLRCLHFFLAHFDISLTASHIAGVYNTAADALSTTCHVTTCHVFFSAYPKSTRPQFQCPHLSKRCYCISAPIGSPHLGEPCFSLHWASISPVHGSDLPLWAEEVLSLLQRCRAAAAPLNRKAFVPLCLPRGSRWPDTPDNQVISLGSPVFPHHEWLWRPFHSRSLSPPPVRTERDKAVSPVFRSPNQSSKL